MYADTHSNCIPFRSCLEGTKTDKFYLTRRIYNSEIQLMQSGRTKDLKDMIVNVIG